MNIREFEEKMKLDIEKIFEDILSIHNYVLDISSKSRSGAEISDFLEDYFVKYLVDGSHPRIYNSKSSPKGKTKNPYDFCFNYRVKEKDFEFDDIVWGDIKAVSGAYNNSNPDLGTPSKVIKFMLDGHFYLMFVLLKYEPTNDGKTKFIPFNNEHFVRVSFLKDVNSSVRINPEPQFQVNIKAEDQYRTKEEFIDMFEEKYIQSLNRVIKKKTEILNRIPITFKKIREIQCKKGND